MMTHAHAPITDAEQTAWQRQAVTVLGRLLELAAREGLPPIGWTVSYAGAQLNGTPPFTASPAARLAGWTAWRAALGEPDKEQEHQIGGQTRLVAMWNRGRESVRRPLLSDDDGYQMITLVLTADIYADDEDQEQEAAAR
jgi:hypothetical protein